MSLAPLYLVTHVGFFIGASVSNAYRHMKHYVIECRCVVSLFYILYVYLFVDLCISCNGYCDVAIV